MERGIVVAGAGSLALLWPAPDVVADAVPNQAIVQIVPGASIDEVNEEHGTVVLGAIESQRLYLLALPEGSEDEQAEEALEADPRVSMAELNDEGETPEAVHAGDTQSFFFYVDPSGFDEQWATVHAGFDSAHGTATGAGVVVAVLDTGVDVTHPALAPRIVAGGYDFVDADAAPDDVGNEVDDDGDGLVDEMVGHGTFVAGLIALTAPSAGILPVRVLDSDGAADAFRVAEGIFHAVSLGADVINLSLGTPAENMIVEFATEFAAEAGVVVVASAGNLGDSEVQYPAASEGVIGVAGTDPDDVKTDFSNYGEAVSLCAPGSGIVSAMPDNAFAEADGTSMAAALVSGAAALLRSTNGSASPEQIESMLRAASVDIDDLNPGLEDALGAGRLDIGQALGQAGPDLDQDGVVGTSDLLALLADWGETGSPADLDGDGTVGVADLLLLLAAWG